MRYNSILERFSTWRRLSRTQRLVARAVAMLGGVALIGANTGAFAAGGNLEGAAPYTGTALTSALEQLRGSLDSERGELEVVKNELARTTAIISYSARYQVPADLTSLVYDSALKEGIDPELAFRVVQIESRFKTAARSRAGAVGLAQVLPATARLYQREITIEDLEKPEVNLRIGFRYLHDLLEIYRGDLKLALLAYNRGPTRVRELLDRGHDPRNGYASAIMDGYRPAASGGGLP